MNKLRILLADDHPYFAELVEGLLGTMFDVVGKVGDGRNLLDAAQRLRPDIILTDISMPILNGIDAIEELQRSGSNYKVIFLTVHTDPDFIRTCFAAGAFGYVFKERVDLDLLPAIQEVLAGRLFISPSTTG